MKKRTPKINFIFLFVLFFPLTPPAMAELSNIQKLACESILCLSSAVRPGECNPALNYFFSIRHRKLSDTLNARRAFLNKCPDSSAAGMQGLINVIVDYSRDNCTVESLNNNMILVMIKVPTGSGFLKKYKTISMWVVDPQIPASCRRYYDALINHEFTAYDDIVYSGLDLGTRTTYQDEDGDEHDCYVIYAKSTTEQARIAEELSGNHWEWH